MKKPMATFELNFANLSELHFDDNEERKDDQGLYVLDTPRLKKRRAEIKESLDVEEDQRAVTISLNKGRIPKGDKRPSIGITELLNIAINY